MVNPRGREISYHLASEARGKLLMPLLFSAATQYALDQNYKYLEAHIISYNGESRRTAKRWGFEQSTAWRERFVLDLSLRGEECGAERLFTYEPRQ